jgi:curved DNA-binding protein CbpA
MADRSFERAFSYAAQQVEAQLANSDVPGGSADRAEEERLRRLDTEMTSEDAIERILLAEKDKNLFRLLSLPPPTIDALGRPKWDVTPLEISKAYRKLSILVHPDKNPGDDARQAFEALNRAHRTLKDEGQLETILKEHLDAARERRDELEARASLEEKIQLKAQLATEAKILRKQEGEDLKDEVLRQMQERLEKARKRKQALARSQKREAREVFQDEFFEDDGIDGDIRSQEQPKPHNGDNSESDGDDNGAVRRSTQSAFAKRRRRLRVAI